MQRAAVAVLACLSMQVTLAADVLQLLQPGSLDGWTTRSFSGDTHYEWVMPDGDKVLRARADASASGLYREGEVSLAQWSSLHWRWRVQAPVAVADERSRDGDDFSARVYVIAAHPLLFWKTRALCYVWGAAVKAGQDWPNPYTGNVHMIALNGAGDAPGEWAQHRRDIAADFKRYFGEAPTKINAVALMTDTDQSGATATAWYADVRFESR